MTSIAFILGVAPLVFATGAGAHSRNSLGTAVFGGMIVSTILNLFVTPVIYVFVARLEDRFGFARGKDVRRGGDGIVRVPAPERART
jgi:HAE1 family hydrophobic/amphiphilic exporter-1